MALAGKEAEYRSLHNDVWPAVLQTLRENGIRKYSIFVRDRLLFSCFEFVGDNLEVAMLNIVIDEITKQWLNLTQPCQTPVESAQTGEWWLPAEQVFHFD